MENSETWTVLVHQPSTENHGAFKVPEFYTGSTMVSTQVEHLPGCLSSLPDQAARLTEEDALLVANTLEDLGCEAWAVPLAKPKRDLEVWFIPAPPRRGLHLKVQTLRDGYVALQAISQYDLYLGREGLADDWANAGGITTQSEDPDDGPNERWDFDYLGDGLDAFADSTGLPSVITVKPNQA